MPAASRVGLLVGSNQIENTLSNWDTSAGPNSIESGIMISEIRTPFMILDTHCLLQMIHRLVRDFVPDGRRPRPAAPKRKWVELRQSFKASSCAGPHPRSNVDHHQLCMAVAPTTLESGSE